MPLLYIGLECSLTNNIMMAQKYLKEALEIAPNDPFVLHELGVIAFQNHRFVKYSYLKICLNVFFVVSYCNITSFSVRAGGFTYSKYT